MRIHKHLNILFLLMVTLLFTNMLAAQNLAQGKSARQSSDYNGKTAVYGAHKAVDGSTDGQWRSRTDSPITHTNPENNPWWEVDLDSVQSIGEIEIWNRTDCCADRLNNFYIMVSERPITANSTTANQFIQGPLDFNTGEASQTFEGQARGRYVRIFISGNNKILSLAEVKVMAGSPFAALDHSKMIPIRPAANRSYEYEMRLTGDALNQPYTIHFDTGSKTTSIPNSYVDRSKVRVIKTAAQGAKDNWGQAADLVEGQLCVSSTDGTTTYCLDNFRFYAKQSGLMIMGAFPAPFEGMPTFPTALADKYAHGTGFGIVSTGNGQNIDANWGRMTSFLQLGPYPGMESQLKWRSDIPELNPSTGFSPDAIPGYSITIDFPGRVADIRRDNLIATIDTGAPDMTMQLGPSNPQNARMYSPHFVKRGLWQSWHNERYDNYASTLINATVKVDFQDDEGDIYSYSFPVGSDPMYRGAPTTLFAGTWGHSVPWPLAMPAKPVNRINLGNTIYFYCPVYYYDIEHKRIGIGFNTASTGSGGAPIAGETGLPKGEKFHGPNGQYYLSFQTDGNLVVKTIEGNHFRWGSYNNAGAPLRGAYGKVQADGNMSIYNKSGQEIWHTNASGGATVSINSAGKPIILAADGSTVWTGQ